MILYKIIINESYGELLSILIGLVGAFCYGKFVLTSKKYWFIWSGYFLGRSRYSLYSNCLDYKMTNVKLVLHNNLKTVRAQTKIKPSQISRKGRSIASNN